MVTDPIADYLTRIRNAIKANHRIVEIPGSNLKVEMTKVLMDKGFIRNYKFEKDNKQGIIKIALKYNPQTKQSAITHLERVKREEIMWAEKSFATFIKDFRDVKSRKSTHIITFRRRRFR